MYPNQVDPMIASKAIGCDKAHSHRIVANATTAQILLPEQCKAMAANGREVMGFVSCLSDNEQVMLHQMYLDYDFSLAAGPVGQPSAKADLARHKELWTAYLNSLITLGRSDLRRKGLSGRVGNVIFENDRYGCQCPLLSSHMIMNGFTYQVLL